jgi:hypothetical protein
MITKKVNYTAPAVIDDLALELEAEILGASVVAEDTEVVSEGQKIETHDFSDSSFNQVWE